MTKKIKVSELAEFDAAEYLNSEEEVAAYLTTVLEENDPALLAAALGELLDGDVLAAGHQPPIASSADGLPGFAARLPGEPTALGWSDLDAQQVGPATVGGQQAVQQVGATTVGGQQAVQQREVPLRRHANMGLSAANDPLGTAGDANAIGNVEGARANGESLRPDMRSALATHGERVSLQAAPAFELVSGSFRSVLPALGQRSAERAAARSVFVPLEGASASNNAMSMYSSNAAAGAGSVAAADLPFPAGASSEVAHKVHYWVTRGAQSAELQLDAFGGSAVDVSISMRGNEAQVEFRSDQPEARRLLQDAMPQLRDMLRSEGLELSGGFVGGSAHQDSRRERDDPDARSGRSATVTAPGQADGGNRRAPPLRPHGLDVFV